MKHRLFPCCLENELLTLIHQRSRGLLILKWLSSSCLIWCQISHFANQVKLLIEQTIQLFMYVWHSKLSFNKYGAKYDQIVLGTLFEVWTYPETTLLWGSFTFQICTCNHSDVNSPTHRFCLSETYKTTTTRALPFAIKQNKNRSQFVFRSDWIFLPLLEARRDFTLPSVCSSFIQFLSSLEEQQIQSCLDLLFCTSLACWNV